MRVKPMLCRVTFGLIGASVLLGSTVAQASPNPAGPAAGSAVSSRLVPLSSYTGPVTAAGDLLLSTRTALDPRVSSPRTMFVTGSVSHTISGFALGQGGSLTRLSGSAATTGAGPLGEVVSPNGKNLYVANASVNRVSAYTIATTGALKAVTGSPVATASGPTGLAVTPNGRFLFVTNFGAGDVSAYAIGTSGALTPVKGSPFSAGKKPVGVAVSVSGAYLYVANSGANDVSAFAISPTGTLAAVKGSPFPAGSGPYGIAPTPDGRHLYVSDSTGSGVSAFTIAGNGTLQQVSQSPFATGTGPSGIAVTPNGLGLYVANSGSGNLSGLRHRGRRAAEPNCTLAVPDRRLAGGDRRPGGEQLRVRRRRRPEPDRVVRDRLRRLVDPLERLALRRRRHETGLPVAGALPRPGSDRLLHGHAVRAPDLVQRLCIHVTPWRHRSLRLGLRGRLGSHERRRTCDAHVHRRWRLHGHSHRDRRRGMLYEGRLHRSDGFLRRLRLGTARGT